MVLGVPCTAQVESHPTPKPESLCGVDLSLHGTASYTMILYTCTLVMCIDTGSVVMIKTTAELNLPPQNSSP
ncbi:UNVERIFIED_CONTAM: hypothetical protein FKN15_042310 [Acipenser sinensis]